jgi:hypothetical protein
MYRQRGSAEGGFSVAAPSLQPARRQVPDPRGRHVASDRFGLSPGIRPADDRADRPPRQVRVLPRAATGRSIKRCLIDTLLGMRTGARNDRKGNDETSATVRVHAQLYPAPPPALVPRDRACTSLHCSSRCPHRVLSGVSMRQQCFDQVPRQRLHGHFAHSQTLLQVTRRFEPAAVWHLEQRLGFAREFTQIDINADRIGCRHTPDDLVCRKLSPHAQVPCMNWPLLPGDSQSERRRFCALNGSLKSLG